MLSTFRKHSRKARENQPIVGGCLCSCGCVFDTFVFAEQRAEPENQIMMFNKIKAEQ